MNQSNLDVGSLVVFIVALIVYMLISPTFDLIGLLVVAGLSGSVVYAYSCLAFVNALKEKIPNRQHRYYGFYFMAAILAFSGSDLFKVMLYMAGFGGGFANILGILAFFGLIYLLMYRYFPSRVHPYL